MSHNLDWTVVFVVFLLALMFLFMTFSGLVVE
jgi:hypothetical protein